MNQRFLFLLLSGCLLWLSSGCSGGIQPPPHPLSPERTVYKPLQVQRTEWPTNAWKTATPASLGVNVAALKKATDYAFVRTGNEKNRKGYRTDGLVIIYKGQLIYERYVKPYKASSPHLTWSVSKSFINALTGIAVHKGLLKVTDKVQKHYPALKGGLKNSMTLRNLLQMSSGLGWNEGYEFSPVFSDVLMMLYTTGRKDMAAFTASRSLRYKPGTRWYYSSGDSNLLAGAIRNAVGKEKFTNWAWTELFDKIGMKSVTWEQDGAGTFVASSYLHATPRDMARFGYLFLNDGVWGGKRLLPKDWVKFSTTVPKGDHRGRYGAQWWLNAGRPSKGIPSRWPDVPASAFCASGHWGQFIFVFPTHDLVVVRVADDRTKDFKRNTFFKTLLAGIPKVSSTGAKPAPRAKKTTTDTPSKAVAAPKKTEPKKRGGSK